MRKAHDPSGAARFTRLTQPGSAGSPVAPKNLQNAAFVAIISILSVAAQNTFAQTKEANGEAAELVEVVVTARQRDETLQDVPVAVTAISAQTLEKMSTTDIRDLANYSSGLIIDVGDSGAGGTINLRGLGTSPTQAGFEQTVSIAIDGVQVWRPRIIRVGLMDVQQIEVLKGPQALFFGKNSPAGVVAIKTADPTDEFSGFVRAGYEFDAGGYKVQGAFSGPLTERIGARLAVSWRDSDGYIKNLFSRPTDRCRVSIRRGRHRCR